MRYDRVSIDWYTLYRLVGCPNCDVVPDPDPVFEVLGTLDYGKTLGAKLII